MERSACCMLAVHVLCVVIGSLFGTGSGLIFLLFLIALAVTAKIEFPLAVTDKIEHSVKCVVHTIQFVQYIDALIHCIQIHRNCHS